MKKLLTLLLALTMLLACVPGMAEKAASPKYVFMFIGDGMGNPQVAATQYYLGTLQNPDSPFPVPADLSFTTFPYLGMVTTYDASSFCPDSASTATSMASGEKTLSGVINYDVTLITPFKLITEYAKEAGKKIGVISSVSVDHATPAAYYAKQPSRNDYYEIAVQGITGNTVDYLAGGGFKKPTGANKDQTDILDLARENGWTITTTNEEVRALTADSGRVLATNPVLQDSKAIHYEIDRKRLAEAGEDVLSLADFVKAGISVLDNDNGFFLMCEGGKIDWAGHANDAATSIQDTLALSDAVQVAVDFAAEHPDETLIIVTADHETGGMTIGFATTAYDTHFDLLANQTISFTDFDAVIADMRESGATFEDALKQVEAYYGLTTAEGTQLSLTATDVANLETAFNMSMGTGEMTDEEAALLYGGYEPFSMAVSHIMNNKAGLSYTSYAHTGLQIPVYAMGVGAEQLSGLYDNTDIFFRTMAIMGLTPDAQ
ncbi:MAG: alkaline phosphatase [Eubacteriales bacterium]|nr:alkaline phosphatase [Eubacteriales bacterium]